MPAVLAVVYAFMGGMARGGWTLDRAVSRSPRPDRWYGGLELLIGLWGFLSAALIPPTNEGALRLIGLEPSSLRQWTVAFVLPLLALVPATAAMGATLPAMERFVSRLAPQRGCVGGLYAANTLGAVAGTLSSVFMIIPAFGFCRTVWLLATINLLCGAAVFYIGARVVSPAAIGNDDTRKDSSQATSVANAAAGRRVPAQEVTPPLSALRLGVTLFLTGLLGIGYEVVGVRVLAQVL